MMTVEALKKELKQKKFHSLYLLVGTEQYLTEEALKTFESAVEEGQRDFNFSVHDYMETPIQTVIEDAETLPFMGDFRVVILKNALFLTGAKDKSKAEHQWAAFEQYMKEPADHTILVISAPYEKLDERKKIVKQLKAEAQVVQTSSLTNDSALQWLKQRAVAFGAMLDDDAAELLISRLGTNMIMLSSEIEKMALYSGEGGIITQETVTVLVASSLEDDIFSLVDHVVHRRNEQALRTFYDLMKQNHEPIQLLALLARQFRIILGVKELQKKGYGEKQMAGMLKLHPYAVKLAAKQAKGYEEGKLRLMLERFAEADYEMKTGKMDKVLLLELILVQSAL